MKNVTVIQSAFIEDALSKLRPVDCTREIARLSVRKITRFMSNEVFKYHSVRPITFHTPNCEMTGRELINSPTLVPIARAGLEMWIELSDLWTNAKTGFIDIKRIDTPEEGSGRDKVEIVCSMKKFPEGMSDGDVILADPMLATGESASFVIQQLKDEGVENIILMCIIACEVGINKINTDHPDVHIYCAVIDPKLTKNNYISPGLGDAGDKMYGKIH